MVFQDLEEREVLHQVDATDFYTLGVAVHHVDDLSRKETVALTHVQEQTGITFFGLARGLFLVRAMVLALVFLVGFALVLLAWCLDFGSIAIIFQESVELHRNHTLQKVFLRKPFQLAVDARKERFDFFLVHLYLFDVIDYLDELLFADFFAGGHVADGELLVDDAFDFLHAALLAEVHDGDGDTRLAGTTRTTASVGIDFHVFGQAVVDDVRQVVHVEPTGSYVRCHEQLQVSLSELAHY